MFLLILLPALLLLFSCSTPGNKDEYLDQFEQFVNRVEEHHHKYKRGDWEWADERFHKFSREWYSEYSGDLNTMEEIKVAELRLRYRSLKTETALSKLKKALRDEAGEVKEELHDYLENQAEEDLEKVVEGARAIGDSAVKVVDDIIKTIKKEKN